MAKSEPLREKNPYDLVKKVEAPSNFSRTDLNYGFNCRRYFHEKSRKTTIDC